MSSASRKGKSKAASIADPSENPFVAQPKPPFGEDPVQRAQRVKSIQDAQATSKRIDEDIAEAKKWHDRRKRALKILLLGQAESGKSTVLKNFQLAYAPAVFQNERSAWRRIVQLNLIRSVKTILDALQEEWAELSPSERETDDHKELRRLHLSLSPLLGLIRDSRILCDDDSQGICVRAGGGWKELFTRGERLSSDSAIINRIQLTKNDPTPLLEASRDDIIAIWQSPTVRHILEVKGIRLEETSGFFLDDTARIARNDYNATDNDIVRARVRTLGVEEHHFVAETGKDKGADFFIADVGGSRTTRASWVPYFDDVDAILFLAPLAFHQMLEEDPRVNRLEDSLSLWRQICENKLLAHATIILFLNKKDILAKTLEAGVQVSRHVPSYTAENNVASVTKYFRDRFKHYHRKLSPIQRTFVVYETSAIETRAMHAVVVAVHDSIIRKNLVNSDII